MQTLYIENNNPNLLPMLGLIFVVVVIVTSLIIIRIKIQRKAKYEDIAKKIEEHHSRQSSASTKRDSEWFRDTFQ